MALFDLIKPAVVEIGKVKIGGLGEERTSRKGGTYRAPMKFDHFVVTSNYRDESGRLKVDEATTRALASYADEDGKLRQIPIAFLSHDLEDVMQSAYVSYQGKRLAMLGDGKSLTIHYDRKANAWLPAPRIVPWVAGYADQKDERGAPLFKLHTTLNFVLAAPNARFGGVYKFRTTSRISASQLLGSLLHLKQLTSGMLRGLPLMLVVRPMQVAPDGKATTVYVVHVEMRGSDLAAIQQQALQTARVELDNHKLIEETQTAYKRLLHQPGTEDQASEAEAAEEFHPPEDASDDPQPTRRDPLLDRLANKGVDGEASHPVPTPSTAPAQLTLREHRAKVQEARKACAIDEEEWAVVCGEIGLPERIEDMQEEDCQTAIRYLEGQ